MVRAGVLLALATFSAGCSIPDGKPYRLIFDDSLILKSPAHCAATTSSPLEPGVRPGTQPRLIPGRKDAAVLLLHGFIASPADVMHLGLALNEAGYTVYMPLIPGFGQDTAQANGSSLEQWRQAIPDAIDFLRPCFQSVHLMGFSLGGALVSDFVLRDDLRQYQAYHGVTIKSVALFAPYYAPEMPGINLLTHMADLFTDSVTLKTAYRFSGNRDLHIPLSNGGFYNDAMPLKAVLITLRLGEQLRGIEASRTSRLPVFLAATDYDRTVDTEAGKAFVTSHFPAHELMILERSQRAVHQLITPPGNGNAADIYARVIDFLNRS